MKTYFALLLLLPLIVTTGCDQKPANNSLGGVALIDLEAVAKRLGRDTQISTELKSTGDQIGAQLASSQQELQGKFNELKDTIGGQPSAEDQQKLAELGRDLNGKFQQRQQIARQELARKRTELVMEFRKVVQPVAMRIASDRDLSTVLVKSDIVVLGNDPAVDITEEVALELLSLQADGGLEQTTPPPAEPAASAEE